jgi:hypothetical protein
MPHCAPATGVPRVTNALAMLRLLPTSNQAKDAEILAFRDQLTVLERQLHGEKVQFAQTDKVFLAACRPTPRWSHCGETVRKSRSCTADRPTEAAVASVGGNLLDPLVRTQAAHTRARAGAEVGGLAGRRDVAVADPSTVGAIRRSVDDLLDRIRTPTAADDSSVGRSSRRTFSR